MTNDDERRVKNAENVIKSQWESCSRANLVGAVWGLKHKDKWELFEALYGIVGYVGVG